MADLTLSLLGPFRAIYGGTTIESFRTNKVQALLICVTVEPGACTRERLMSLLWPGMPERSARHNLRQTLYHLRTIIPDVSREAHPTPEQEAVPLLLANRQKIELNPAVVVEIDTRSFTRLIDGALIHDHPDLYICHSCRKDLERAVDLYRGDFLADFYLDDSNEFEEWSQVRREAFRRKALDALEILATIHIRQKEYGRAIDLTQRQLEIDNLREGAYRQLMEVLALNGRRAEALAVYDKCRQMLAEELGMAPSKRTTEIYNKIVANDLSFDAFPTDGIRGYELKDEIGAGAYGAIYRAIQPVIGREVAVKVIHRKFANDPEFIRRFEAEAQTIAHLEYPYIVPLYDYWRDPDGAYLIMRYLKGGNLLTALETGPWGPDKALRMLDQVAAALSTAHNHGIVHRDIKPANILLDDEGNAFLSDFGIAKDLTGEMHLTAEGAIIGTPDYISPEQIKNEPVSPQTDIYSLGAVLYETLTGEKPFPDSSVANLIYRHLNDPVPLVKDSRPDLPAQIDLVIQRATAKRPSDRYADALEMAKAFKEAIHGSPGVPAPSIPSTIPIVKEVYNPYKGLRPFQQIDADDFFGREVLVQQFLEHLDPAGGPTNNERRDPRFLALIGPSGSGKSSVVKAGLIPALRDGAVANSEKWFVAEMVPGTHPLEELEQALWPIAVDPPPSLIVPMQRDTRGLLRTIRRILPDEPGAQLLLIIDQFEELYTLVDDKNRRHFFIESLLQALDVPRSPLRVIITLRADFYDRPLQHEALGRIIKANTEVILPLTTEELTWAIREPARRLGISLEEGLTEAIVADLADQPGALPLLQYALTELFERRQNNIMKQGAYREIGGVHGALGRRAEEIYTSLDISGQESARQLFLRLVTLGEGSEDTRRRVLRSELEAIGEQKLTINNQQLIINYYGEARLLTFDHDPLTRQPTVEVAHEALLREWKRLRGWLDESRNDVRLQRTLATAAAEWRAAGQDPGFLLWDARLNQFAGWAETTSIALTGDEQAYLQASLADREARVAEEEARRQRELETAQKLAETEHARAGEQAQAADRLRQRALLLTGALIIAAVLAVAALYLARQSNQNALTAEENAALAATREIIALAEAGQRATAQAETEREREQAEAQRTLAVSRELAAAAITNLVTDPERSTLLSLAALDTAFSREAEEALHAALPRLRVIYTLAGHEDHVNDVAYSPGGDRLVTTSSDATARIWDLATGQELLLLSGHEDRVNQVDYSPDGARVATASDDGTARVWDAQTGEALFILDGHMNNTNLELPDQPPAVTNVLFSPDNALLVTAANDGMLIIWDANTGQALGNYSTEDHIVGPMTFNADGTRLAVAGSDGFARVIDVATGEILLELIGHEPTGWVTGIVYNKDETILLTVAKDQTVRQWDSSTGEELQRFTGIDGGSLTLSPDGSRFLTPGVDGIARIWDAVSGRELLTLTGHQDRVWGAVFNPDGNNITTASADGTAKIWDLELDHELLTVSPFAASTQADLSALAISPDDSLLAVAGFSGEISLLDFDTGREIRKLGDHEAFVGGLNFDRDGQLLVSAADDQTVKIWDVQTGALTLALEEPGSPINDAVFSPDGSLIAGVGTEQNAIVWDANSGEILYTLPLGEWAWAVAFSPDGSLLATGDLAGNIVLWNAEDGQPQREISYDPDKPNAAYRISFTPEGDNIIVAGLDGMVKVWDPRSGAALQTIKAHQSLIWGMDISPDGRTLATAAGDNTARLWDLSTGERLLTLTGHSGALTDVAFNRDGRRLVTTSRDGTVRVNVLALDELVKLARSRVTRSLTEEECRQYLHLDACPDN